MTELIYTSKKRSCGECTECCEGWLWGDAHGKPFFAGRPCHFVSHQGCSIYNDRPHSPCKTFVCSWLGDEKNVFPEWMRPDKSGVLMQPNTTKNGFSYISVYECGRKIDSSVLNWLILYTLGGGQNISVQVGGGWSHYGTQDFLRDINS